MKVRNQRREEQIVADSYVKLFGSVVAFAERRGVEEVEAEEVEERMHSSMRRGFTKGHRTLGGSLPAAAIPCEMHPTSRRRGGARARGGETRGQHGHHARDGETGTGGFGPNRPSCRSR